MVKEACKNFFLHSRYSYAQVSRRVILMMIVEVVMLYLLKWWKTKTNSSCGKSSVHLTFSCIAWSKIIPSWAKRVLAMFCIKNIFTLQTCICFYIKRGNAISGYILLIVIWAKTIKSTYLIIFRPQHVSLKKLKFKL